MDQQSNRCQCVDIGQVGGRQIFQVRANRTGSDDILTPCLLAAELMRLFALPPTNTHHIWDIGEPEPDDDAPHPQPQPATVCLTSQKRRSFCELLRISNTKCAELFDFFFVCTVYYKRNERFFWNHVQQDRMDTDAELDGLDGKVAAVRRVTNAARRMCANVLVRRLLSPDQCLFGRNQTLGYFADILRAAANRRSQWMPVVDGQLDTEVEPTLETYGRYMDLGVDQLLNVMGALQMAACSLRPPKIDELYPFRVSALVPPVCEDGKLVFDRKEYLKFRCSIRKCNNILNRTFIWFTW